eukprot:TRINITY_DN3762_c0_g1_i1.p1 TRINITY_DN3762_c0_g1~~TRINITY_DN3762_c0_g1_i1.p1  ORF type:complete len:457 (+),score=89.10 TRINITY_DN3762_c0_g1_i1:313-1683(+)
MTVGRVGHSVNIGIAHCSTAKGHTAYRGAQQYRITSEDSRIPKLLHFFSAKTTKPMSISSSLPLFPPKIPQNPLYPRKPITNIPCFSSFPAKSSSFSSISIQNQPKSSSSPSPPPPPSLQSVEELPPKLQEIIKLFQTVQDPRAKYEQLLYYGRTLSPLPSHFKTKENKVEGCVSQVWVRAFLDPDEKKVFFEADSDSMLTKGLAALLVEGLSGCSVSDIVKVSPDFVGLLGLRQSLTPSRNNGFLNMLRLMQKKALQLYVEEAAQGGGGEFVNDGVFKVEDRVEGPTTINSNSQQNSENSSSNLNGVGGVESNSSGFSENSSLDANGFGDTDLHLSGFSKDLDSDSKSDSNGVSEINSSSGRGMSGSRGERIKERLERELSPVELQVEDISYLHAGHVGVKGSNGETHFNVRIVSKEFEGKSMVKRHRLVYDVLKEELKSGLHALSIVAKTPDEI